MEWPSIQGFTLDKRFGKWIDGCLDGWLVWHMNMQFLGHIS